LFLFVLFSDSVTGEDKTYSVGLMCPSIYCPILFLPALQHEERRGGSAKILGMEIRKGREEYCTVHNENICRISYGRIGYLLIMGSASRG
jgi:hypothetical protein